MKLATYLLVCLLALTALLAVAEPATATPSETFTLTRSGEPMRLHRRRRAGVVALLSSATTAVLAATLVLPMPASASARPDSGPDLASGSDAPARSSVVFRATRDGGPAGIDSFSTADILCWLTAFNPRVPALKPTEIEGFAAVQCTGWIPVIIVSVSLFRGDDRISTHTSTGTGHNYGTSTFGPCQGGAYYSTGSAVLFAPPGYFPPQLHLLDVSGVSVINEAGTAVPPWVCRQPSTPPPPPPPPPGLPVINSLLCEYDGNNQFHCSLSASNWTQIRWTYNGTRQAAWDNRTGFRAGCGGGTPTLRATVSNANGSVTAQDSFRCEGMPL